MTRTSLVVFRSADGHVIGNGVLLCTRAKTGSEDAPSRGEWFVLTCCHVILAMRGLQRAQYQSLQNYVVQATCGAHGSGPAVSLEVVDVSGPDDDDYAVLRLAMPEAAWPDMMEPYQALSRRDWAASEKAFVAYGVDETCLVRERLVHGLIRQRPCPGRRLSVQVTAIDPPAPTPTKGYSGSPLWSDSPSGGGVLAIWAGYLIGQRASTAGSGLQAQAIRVMP